MKKTGSQIERDIFHLVKESVISSAINGSVYREGTRPNSSQKEDAIVIFITALDGQVQDGVVSINVYVPNKNYGTYFLKDIKRCTEIEEICQQFFDSLPTNEYLFSLGQMISTFKHPEIEQHFVNVKLKFKHNTLKS